MASSEDSVTFETSQCTASVPEGIQLRAQPSDDRNKNVLRQALFPSETDAARHIDDVDTSWPPSLFGFFTERKGGETVRVSMRTDHRPRRIAAVRSHGCLLFLGHRLFTGIGAATTVLFIFFIGTVLEI